MRVVVLEAEVAGFGASGRNGAWCNSAFPVSPGELARRFGAEATQGPPARDAGRGRRDRQGRGGRGDRRPVLPRRAAPGRPRASPAARHTRRLRVRAGARPRGRPPAARRRRRPPSASGSPDARGALYNPHCATIHPARLARGLARAVERLGGEIFERTTVTDFETGANPRLVTDVGEVRARRDRARGGGLPGAAAQAAPPGAAHLLPYRPDRAALRGRSGPRSAGRAASAWRPTATPWTTSRARPTGAYSSGAAARPTTTVRA